jgi:hypothetical protein
MLKVKSFLLASGALVLGALPLSPAMAAAPLGFAGTVGASYGQADCDGCGDSSDAWGINGSGAFGFGGAFGGQIDVGYSSIEETDLFGIRGSLFWAPAMGRLGATVSWQTTDVEDFGFDIDVDGLTYGVFGEYYFGNVVTLGAKGGGISVNFDGGGLDDDQTGSYVGAALTGYIMPNLAIQGDVLFTGADDFFGTGDDLDSTTFTIGAEYLVSEMVPIAIFGSYSFGNVDFGGDDVDTNKWTIGARFYFGSGGPTLVDKHRNGTLHWIGATDATSLISP